MDVFKSEEVDCSADDLKIIVNQYYPDIRKMLNTIQLSIQDSEVVIDKSVLVSSNYMVQVLKELSDKGVAADYKWKIIRQIIADANIQDFEELYRYLYDNADKFASGKEGMVAYHINEYSYQSNFRIDKEINCMALINQLINV